MSEFKLRMEAAERGEKRYQGRDCARSHGGLRYTSSGSCIECDRLKNKAAAAKLRDLLRAATTSQQ